MPANTCKPRHRASSFSGPISGSLVGKNLGKRPIWETDCISLRFPTWRWGLGWGVVPTGRQDVTFKSNATLSSLSILFPKTSPVGFGRLGGELRIRKGMRRWRRVRQRGGSSRGDSHLSSPGGLAPGSPPSELPVCCMDC